MTKPVVSCGVLVLTREAELLLGHAANSRYWDIPKGVAEPGEAPREAALRELREETALAAAGESLLEIGRFAYRRGKDLHLFALLSRRRPLATFSCATLFRDRQGRMRPEFDAFAWVSFDQITVRCAPSMVTVLNQSISLPTVLGQLLGDESERAG
ncbi:MAG: NUDIX hydrolase [Burkholderiales bacterium]|nr:MAG: NUDIX hydrolase [Burkholderiales bacterium]